MLAADPLFVDGVDLSVFLVVLLKTVVAFAVPLVLTALMIWVERKVHGDMTNRIGPNRAGPWGILQTLADGAKLFTKEGMVPDNADSLVYRLAPYLSAVPAFLVFAVVPFGGDFNDGGDGTVSILGHETYLQLADPQPGILVVLALSGIAVYGVMLAGWSSGSKYPLLGAVRESAQMVSYEAALGLSLAAVVLVTGTLSTHSMVVEQAGGGTGLLPDWNIIVTGLVPFVIFFIAATAEMSRPPFDFAEAEQELVAGFNTEYSSIRFALFYIAEFMATITFGAVIATLFLGGPAGPDLGILPGWAWGTVWFFLKLAIFPFIWISFRATLPRLRYDQLMDLGWKLLIPLSLGWLLVLAAIRVSRDEGIAPVVATTVGVLAGALLLSAAVGVGKRRRELRGPDRRDVRLMGLLGGFKVTIGNLLNLRGGETVTTEYPKEKRPKAERLHGRHVLNRYEDGMEKCIGCELCAGVCPAKCIYVRGQDNDPADPVSPGERFGFVYEINYLRCIHCDLCVEACPTEAITESKLFEFSFTNRDDAIYTKDELVVDDDGMPRRLPWEDWSDFDTVVPHTSAWVRATAASGSAEHVGEVGWSGELGFGVRAPEAGQAAEDAVDDDDSDHDHDDHGHGGHH